MDKIEWLMLANVAVWIGLGAYLAFMAVKQANIAKRLARLEMLDLNNQDNSNS